MYLLKFYLIQNYHYIASYVNAVACNILLKINHTFNAR